MRNHIYAGLITATIVAVTVGVVVSETVRYFAAVGLVGGLSFAIVASVYLMALVFLED